MEGKKSTDLFNATINKLIFCVSRISTFVFRSFFLLFKIHKAKRNWQRRHTVEWVTRVRTRLQIHVSRNNQRRYRAANADPCVSFAITECIAVADARDGRERTQCANAANANIRCLILMLCVQMRAIHNVLRPIRTHFITIRLRISKHVPKQNYRQCAKHAAVSQSCDALDHFVATKILIIYIQLVATILHLVQSSSFAPCLRNCATHKMPQSFALYGIVSNKSPAASTASNTRNTAESASN